MGLKPHQIESKLENAFKFTDYMNSILEEARSAVYKSQKDILRYYNQ